MGGRQRLVPCAPPPTPELTPLSKRPIFLSPGSAREDGVQRGAPGQPTHLPGPQPGWARLLCRAVLCCTVLRPGVLQRSPPTTPADGRGQLLPLACRCLTTVACLPACLLTSPMHTHPPDEGAEGNSEKQRHAAKMGHPITGERWHTPRVLGQPTHLAAAGSGCISRRAAHRGLLPGRGDTCTRPRRRHCLQAASARTATQMCSRSEGGCRAGQCGTLLASVEATPGASGSEAGSWLCRRLAAGG